MASLFDEMYLDARNGIDGVGRYIADTTTKAFSEVHQRLLALEGKATAEVKPVTTTVETAVKATTSAVVTGVDAVKQAILHPIRSTELMGRFEKLSDGDKVRVENYVDNLLAPQGGGPTSSVA